MDLCFASAVELSTRLRHRELSTGALLDAMIARAEQVSPTINPLAVKLYDRARRAAARADQRLAAGTAGPLCGLPLTVKDSQWLAGVPCANGASSQADFVPAESSAAVQRLEDAGAVIFAKTTCPEFSYVGVTESELYGRTSNPWNLERVSGGSSGGAAAAVAAGVGPLSLGGDGGGSIRIQAAFCGVVGFKPTHGLVPREPCYPAWKNLAVYGPLARSVADARLMLDAIAGPHHLDRHGVVALKPEPDLGSLEGVRVAVSEDLGFAPVDLDVRAAFKCTVTRLRDAGAEIVADAPGLPSSVETWSTIAFAEAWV